MKLATEKGETCNNILTIYPIQSVHCVKGLLMMNTLWLHNRIQDFWSKQLKDIHGYPSHQRHIFMSSPCPIFSSHFCFRLELRASTSSSIIPMKVLHTNKDLLLNAKIKI